MLILLSSPDQLDNELTILNNLFEMGLNYFHLRKPNFSLEETRLYLKDINPIYYPNIVLHQHYKLAHDFPLKGIHLTEKTKKTYQGNQQIISAAFHQIEAINEYLPSLNYAFLSPIFNSISKPNYASAFSLDQLKTSLPELTTSTIALGGMEESKIKLAKEIGFSGVALLGSIWQHPAPIHAFEKCQKVYEEVFSSD